MATVINATQAFNLPKDVQIGETTFKLYELDGNDMAEFEAWANGVLLGQFEELWKTLGPLLAVASPKGPDDQSALAVIECLKYLDRIAADRTMKYFQIGTAEVTQLLLSWVGARELLYLAIKHGDPTFTRAAAQDLFGKVSPSFIDKLPEYVGLVAPTPEGQPDPKAGPEASTPGETQESTAGEPVAASTSSDSSATSS